MHVFLAIAFESVEQWIAAGGYAVLFALLFLCGLGLPLPEDIPLMIAGALIANGKFHLGIAAVCAWCGIIGGDLVLYHFGKKFGLEITRVPFIGKHVTKERIEKVEKMFLKYGFWVVAVGRMFAGIRGAMVVAAGAIRYRLITFIIADGLAAIVSGGLFLWIGHWLGSRLREHLDQISHYKLEVGGVLLLLAAIIVAIIVIRKKRSHKAPETTQEPVAAATSSTPDAIQEPVDGPH